MMKFIALLLFYGAVLNGAQINIAVAANVSYAMDELKAAFVEKYPGTKVRVSLGSSGKLTAQIRNGAPYGLFMSANMAYPEALYADNLAVSKPAVYAHGALAYLSVKGVDFSRGMAVTVDPSVKKIAVANPKTAPYGKAAVEAMQNGGVYDAVIKKLVYGESIAQTVAYAATATDLGFIAKSSLYSSKMARYKEGIHWASVDSALYRPIEQGVVLLKGYEDQPAYRAFYDFILSNEAKSIFKKYGYIVP